ncbi:HpcH/HpaI aldolase/citrate lyase family protein [Sphingomonas sp. KC8]|uniref:HpcH/HpaI aldolase/citrate lyase family protein n=1 Tax=Sphingomonas sp. KC8 TaxID=1030157 RepID=UPI000248A3A1|nr:CoA ester lyase [Sphingomonas sp. KC8]ARS28866.1 citrate lyase subunit beta [Sphingomonas sp. KC8]
MSASERAAAARSWLFVPGDSEKKLAKGVGTSADILLIDLEDAVAESAKPAARETVAAFLRANADQRDRLWVRINPLQGPHALHDLAAIVPARPGGVMLPKPRGRADVERLDHFLTALEVAAGDQPGLTQVIIVATETPQGMLATGSYEGVARLAAMTWGAEDIATAIGAITNRRADGSYDFPYQLARTFCVVGAAAAGVPAIETIHGDFRDEAGLEAVATEARRAGFRGMMAIHPAQVDIINRAFTPSEAELVAAREIVDLFAANPGLGTIGHRGEMLDLPHLNRAKAVLARGGAA